MLEYISQQREAERDYYSVVAMERLENLPEFQFKQQLDAMYNAAKKTVIIKKDEYFNLIEELKEASRVKPKSRRQYYILKR